MALKYTTNNHIMPTYVFRNEIGHLKADLEKRQLFLRSYQFSRKLTVSERIKKSSFRVKRVKVLLVRNFIISAKRIKKFVWLKVKNIGLSLVTTVRRRRSSRSFQILRSHRKQPCSYCCFC